jgi:hypothetical protein
MSTTNDIYGHEVMIIVMRNLTMIESLGSLDTQCKIIIEDAGFSMSIFRKEVSRGVTVDSSTRKLCIFHFR